MKTKHKAIKELLNHYKEISLLGKINAVLGWDLNVNLPEKASMGRSEQAAYLTEKSTALWKDKLFTKTLSGLNKDDTSLTPQERAIVRNLQHASNFYLKVPEEIIIKREKVTSQAFMVWQKARSENKYKDFAPYLKEIISISQIIAQHLGYVENPYDSLLDMYEQQLTASDCQKMFTKLQPTLTKLIKNIQSKRGYTTESKLLNGSLKYDSDSQRKLTLFVLRKMGFDFSAGRLDISAHPFTTTLDDRNDVRVTTRYIESDFRDSFTSAMHEGGHRLYEQQINEDFDNTPLQNGVSLGIHEAMSRFYENQIGKHPAFLTYMTPLFQSFFPDQLAHTDANEIIRTFNLVKPSFVRIEADEVTYTLHIILRFEMENDLINQRIKPEDAPEAWRAKMKKYFGIVPTTDTDGILQDVHWAYGSFGYFPSYAFGNLYACQFLAKMKQDIPVDSLLKEGDLGTITSWLKENIYQYGALYWPKELVKKVTGKKLEAEPFINYLTEKFSSIYNL